VFPEPLRHLTRNECLALLAGARLGRVAVSIRALPTILPVNYALLDDDVVLRTAPGSKLSAALLGAVVGFEVDDTNQDRSAGWSVLVVGHANEIRDDATLGRARGLRLEAWAPGDHDHFVMIPTEHVSGRAFGPSPAFIRTPMPSNKTPCVSR